jgi:hypothetical protein
LVQTVTEIAAERRCTPTQLALTWLLHQGEDIVAISGMRHRASLDENAAAATLKLTREESHESTESCGKDSLCRGRDGAGRRGFGCHGSPVTQLRLADTRRCAVNRTFETSRYRDVARRRLRRTRALPAVLARDVEFCSAGLFWGVAPSARNRHNPCMGVLHRTSCFVSSLWAGLAASTGLFANPPSYPYFAGTFSVPQSFGQVRSYLSHAVSRHRDQFRLRQTTRK